jgi:hypothetical protein
LNSATNSSDERLIAEENVPQPVQHTLFQFVGTDAAVGIT